MDLQQAYERDVRLDELDRWLQRWGEEGWLAVGCPSPIGTDSTGAALVRQGLERTVASRHRPSQPYLVLVRSPDAAAAWGRAASPGPP